MVTAAAQASRAAIKVDEARAKGNIKEDQKQERQQRRFQSLNGLCSDAGGILAAAAASKNGPGSAGGGFLGMGMGPGASAASGGAGMFGGGASSIGGAAAGSALAVQSHFLNVLRGVPPPGATPAAGHRAEGGGSAGGADSAGGAGFATPRVPSTAPPAPWSSESEEADDGSTDQAEFSSIFAPHSVQLVARSCDLQTAVLFSEGYKNAVVAALDKYEQPDAKLSKTAKNGIWSFGWPAAQPETYVSFSKFMEVCMRIKSETMQAATTQK